MIAIDDYYRPDRLGLTSKENCPDLRNSKVYDLIREHEGYGANVSVRARVADPAEAKTEYGIMLTSWESLPIADVIVLAVMIKRVVGFGGRLVFDSSKLDVAPGKLLDILVK